MHTWARWRTAAHGTSARKDAALEAGPTRTVPQRAPCVVRQRVHLQVGRGGYQGERKILCDVHRRPRREPPRCNPLDVHCLVDHRAVDGQVAHVFPNRRQQFVEAQAEEKRTEHVALLHPVKQQTRSKGPHPAGTIIVAAPVALGP